MTTIIYKDKKIYSDTQLSEIDNKTGKLTAASVNSKVLVLNSGDIIVGAGKKIIIDEFASIASRSEMAVFGKTFIWSYKSDQNSLKYLSGISNIFVTTRRNLYVVTVSVKIRTLFGLEFAIISPSWKKLETCKVSWCCIGSGAAAASRFLDQGYEPDVAIKLAAQYDEYTNSIVEMVDISSQLCRQSEIQ